MQRLEFSGAVRPIYGSLGVKRLNTSGRTMALSSTQQIVWESQNLLEPSRPVQGLLYLYVVS